MIPPVSLLSFRDLDLDLTRVSLIPTLKNFLQVRFKDFGFNIITHKCGERARLYFDSIKDFEKFN